MFFDGNDNEIPLSVMMDEMDNYVTFKEAARMIDRGWSTNYLHKQKAIGRIDMSKIAYVIDESMAEMYPSTKGKRMFIHKSEIERFKTEEYPKIRKTKRGNWENYCPFCRVKIEICMQRPCQERLDVLIIERARIHGSKKEMLELSSKIELKIPVSGVKKK